MLRLPILATILAFPALPSQADPARVDSVSLAERSGTWTVSVTISHGDTGWDDYADGWRVETPEGEVLATRVLHHPHVEEQPFTRSLPNVPLPDGLTDVMIRTRTNTEGWAETAWGPFELPDAP